MLGHLPIEDDNNILGAPLNLMHSNTTPPVTTVSSMTTELDQRLLQPPGGIITLNGVLKKILLKHIISSMVNLGQPTLRLQGQKRLTLTVIQANMLTL